ncbi:nitroreductase/quinone reductase family protein [Actinopolymorpha rutila]|uniref:Deazaflavin-dependent oxidoreductase (Nitroreductase family) n=1 Tax=Actinopolymorpha rutila TaxID=446787 RepID=A0A852ZLD1_9ACTN|nr:nitroreductase/quinone reductase family protein [Actinopolymorpha rutila]NYH90010.1 deazaflavin-dependent oxidoreductase (nitroreductase family) [Actinopolymorpha rutila]
MPADFQQSVIEEFRANAGVVGGPFEGSSLLLLTTVGARTGAEHTVPLGYLRDGDRLLVVGSAGGSHRHPAWYHNLLANPLVRVEIGTEVLAAVAVPAEGAERDRLFDLAVAAAPGYADYQRGTDRVLPVVALEPSYTISGTGTGTPTTAVRTLADQLVQIHSWLRAQLEQVRAQAETYFAARTAHAASHGPGGPPAPGISLQLRRHCLAFCESMHGHHVTEDAAAFPALEREHPDLRPALARLRAEHENVAAIRAELADLLADITVGDPERFRAELDRLTTVLLGHLNYEEEALVPTLAAIPLPPPRGAGPAPGN